MRPLSGAHRKFIDRSLECNETLNLMTKRLVLPAKLASRRPLESPITRPQGLLRIARRRVSLIRRHFGLLQSASFDALLRTVLAPAGMEHARLVEAAIGMRAEVVAKALQQVRRSAGAAKAVVVGEGRGKGRRRNALLDRPRHDQPPCAIGARNGVAEAIGEQQI